MANVSVPDAPLRDRKAREVSDALDSSRPGSSPARKIVWGLVVVLAIAHYDFWYWDDGSLLAGFMPIGLFYHALISVLAAIVWALASIVLTVVNYFSKSVVCKTLYWTFEE